MHTPVRYYITRDDDRPVVRSIPVAMRPEPNKLEEQVTVETEETTRAAQNDEVAASGRVKTLMRNAVRRPTRAK
jgi:hypothetical protein